MLIVMASAAAAASLRPPVAGHEILSCMQYGTNVTNCVQKSLLPCYIDQMRNSLRLFFLCLLIVALPMRSMAGLATAECGMDHHTAADPGVEHGAMPAHEMADAGAHEAGHDATYEDDIVIAQGEQGCDDCETTSGVHEAAGCGTCAECCIGACAPPPVVVVTAVEEAVSNVQQFPLSSFTGHIRARIERPPRLA